MLLTQRIKFTLLMVSGALPLFIQAQQPQRVAAFVRPGDGFMSHAYFPDFVETSPQFPGGEAALIRFVNSERSYPRDAYEEGIQGRVFCTFIVDTDGTILDVRAQRGPSESLCREAIRIIECMPRWEAGTVDGHRVPVMVSLAIPFRL